MKLMSLYILLFLSHSSYSEEAFKDYMIQSPRIEGAKRGSLKGDFAELGAKALSLKTGSFNFSLPLKFPSKRGEMLKSFGVSYSPGFGVSEFGIGWSSNFSITRFREIGKVDYISDDLMTPWGQMLKGDDGYFYTKDVLSKTKLELIDDEIVVYLSDGKKLYFGSTSDSAYTDKNLENKTYRWYLKSATTLVGHESHFEYTRASIDEVSYLTKISYGGLGTDFQHVVTFEYLENNVPLIDNSTGISLKKNKRVYKIIASSLESSSFINLYEYRFSYKLNSNSPAFYLTSIQKFFTETDFEPKLTYSYDDPATFLETASWSEQAGFESIISKYHTQFTNRNSISFNDFNNDGKTDFEIGKDYKIYLNKDAGPEEMNLAAPSGEVSDWCLFPVVFSRNSRKFIQPLGAGTETYVFDLFSWGDGSVLDICKLNGERVNFFTFPKFWKYGTKTIFSDINGDTLPDIVHLRGNSYEVITNTSSAGVISFSAPSAPIPLNLPTDIHGFWINDINGDGHGDMVLKGKSSLYAHYGDSSGGFSKDYRPIRFYLPSGHSNSTDISGRSIQFIDFNKDGLKDAMIQGDGVVSIYINNGVNFVQHYIPGLFVGGHIYNNLISGDISGNGNFQLLTTTIGDNKLLSLELDRYSLGLMTSMDDGKGNTVALEFSKSKAQEGIPNRKTIISKLTRTTVGEGVSEFSTSYGNIKEHSLTKNFLGFEEFSSIKNSKGESKSTYSYDLKNRGKLLSSESFDYSEADFIQFSTNTFVEKSFQGLTYNFKSNSTSGYKNTDGSIVSEVHSTSTIDEASLCSLTENKSNSEKSLLTTKVYEDVSAASDHLACFVKDVQISGDNFSYNMSLERDLSARVTKVSKGSITLQTITYGLNGQIDTLTEAGKGTSNFEYDSNYRLNKVISPDQSITSILNFNILNDSPKDIKSSRGTSDYIQEYRFDPLGRLEKQWHNLGSFSEGVPQKSYIYQFATALAPSITEETESFNYEAGLSSSKKNYFFETGAGKLLANAIKSTGTKYAVSGVNKVDQFNFESKSYRSYAVEENSNFFNYKMSDINYSGNETGSEIKSSLGSSKVSTKNTFESLVKTNVITRDIDSGLVRTTTVVNTDNNLKSIQSKDSFGHERSFLDEEGNLYQYVKDSLGRVSDISFPGGDVQQISYHPVLGSVSHIYRSGYGSITFEYDLVTTLLKSKSRFDKNGVLTYRSDYLYDGIGRVTFRTDNELNTDGSVKDSALFEYLYDGNYFNSASDATQVGFLTAIRGNHFVKEFSYAPDSKMNFENLYIDGEKKLYRNYDYYDQREIKSINYGVDDLVATTNIFDKTLTYEYESDSNAISSILDDGASFLDFNYSELLEVSGFNLGGSLTTTGRDANTGRVTSIDNSKLTRSWQFSNRDLIDSMTVVDGTRVILKNYGYSNRGFLETLGQTDTGGTNLDMSYSYDVDGLMDSFTRDGSVKNIQDLGSSWDVGGESYGLDDFGRVISKNGKVFSYGPTGRVSGVSENSSVLASYFYDEENNPIVKIYADGSKEFYFDDGIFSNGEFYLPIESDALNYAFGYFKNDQWVSVESDHLNTLLKDSSDNVNISTPYGERDVRTSIDHKVLDFTLKGYDSELEAVRMGHRFYDPVAKRFLTPDSYFVENYGEVLRSPVEGNLYSYGGNNPVMNTDPTGDCVEPLSFIACVGGITAATSAITYVAGKGAVALRNFVNEQKGVQTPQQSAAYSASANSKLAKQWNVVGRSGLSLTLVGDAVDVLSFATGTDYSYVNASKKGSTSVGKSVDRSDPSVLVGALLPSMVKRNGIVNKEFKLYNKSISNPVGGGLGQGSTSLLKNINTGASTIDATLDIKGATENIAGN